MANFAPRLLALAGLLLAAAAPPVHGQDLVPQATSVVALLTFPDYYHGRPVVIRGDVESEGARHRVRSGDGARLLPLVFRDRSVPSGLVDLRGQLWDVGQMRPDDPRLVGYDLGLAPGLEASEWPRPGDLVVFAVSASLPTVRPPDSAVSLRAVALEPDRYDGRTLTLRGQYRGRNLFGEVPRAPGISRWDFLIRSAGAGLWVTGMRPRGRGFQFELDSKLETERWLEVKGVVRQGRGLVWLEAASLALADAGADTEALPEPETPLPAAPPPPPPEAVFSIPTEGETDVPAGTTVRVQFSRNIDPKTFEDHVRIGYLGQAAAGTPPAPPMEFTVSYDDAARALEIRFAKPLERFRTLKIELTEGILGTDGQPLEPWTLTFSVGG